MLLIWTGGIASHVQFLWVPKLFDVALTWKELNVLPELVHQFKHQLYLSEIKSSTSTSKLHISTLEVKPSMRISANVFPEKQKH